MDVRVVLVEPKRDENVGAVARVMKNFGFRSLYIVSCNALGEHAFHVASHAEDVLERCEIVDTIEDATAGSHVIVGTTAKTGSEMNVLRRPFVEPEQLWAFAMRKNGILSIIFGREDIGLLNEELKKCDFILHIPTHHEYPVMNLSHAVAVVLYELHKASLRAHRARRAQAATRLASVEEKERLLAHFRMLLERVERREHRRERTLIVLRHIFGRAAITSREVRTVHGMLRKTLRMLKRADDVRE